MPYVHLVVKPHRRLEKVGMMIARRLPNIIAPALSLEEQEIHEGKVTPAEIMVWPIFDQDIVNGKEFEILIFAHNFNQRIANIDDRKEVIVAGMRNLMRELKCSASVAVCIMLLPMAYMEM